MWYNFQVHVSAVGPDKMRVTLITDDDAPATVDYGTASGQYPFSATGTTTDYSYLLYHSGNIHDAVATHGHVHCRGRPLRGSGVQRGVGHHPARAVRRQGPEHAAGEDGEDRQGRGAWSDFPFGVGLWKHCVLTEFCFCWVLECRRWGYSLLPSSPRPF